MLVESLGCGLRTERLQFVRTVSFPLPEYSMPTWLCAVVFDEKRIADDPATNERPNTLLFLPSRSRPVRRKRQSLKPFDVFLFSRYLQFLCYFFQSLLSIFRNDFRTNTWTSLRSRRSLSLT